MHESCWNYLKIVFEAKWNYKEHVQRIRSLFQISIKQNQAQFCLGIASEGIG